MQGVVKAYSGIHSIGYLGDIYYREIHIMPIVNFHLVANTYSDEQCQQLLEKSSQLYAEVLESPIIRVRAFINVYEAKMMSVSGQVIKDYTLAAPYFEFIVLAGRSIEQRQRLLIGFTELIKEILGVEASLIRGCCRHVEPEDWCIGGITANNLRAKEIQERR